MPLFHFLYSTYILNCILYILSQNLPKEPFTISISVQKNIYWIIQSCAFLFKTQCRGLFFSLAQPKNLEICGNGIQARLHRDRNPFHHSQQLVCKLYYGMFFCRKNNIFMTCLTWRFLLLLCPILPVSNNSNSNNNNRDHGWPSLVIA